MYKQERNRSGLFYHWVELIIVIVLLIHFFGMFAFAVFSICPYYPPTDIYHYYKASEKSGVL